MPTSDIKRALSKLKEMQQFGPGLTFSDMMEAFRLSGDGIAEIWPWVDFSQDGDLKCTIMPLPKGKGYELILVQALAPVRFPEDERMGFRIANIEQHITVIEGSMIIEKPDGNITITEDETIKVNNDELLAYTYHPGVFLFRQIPRVAKEMDFTFEFLNQ